MTSTGAIYALRAQVVVLSLGSRGVSWCLVALCDVFSLLLSFSGERSALHPKRLQLAF